MTKALKASALKPQSSKSLMAMKGLQQTYANCATLSAKAFTTTNTLKVGDNIAPHRSNSMSAPG